MMTLQLDMYQACALGAVVYALGRLMVKKISFLNRYCIPAPVAGGIVFALLHLGLYSTGILEFTFDTTVQTILMTVFFCSVGFTACFRLLKKGGIQVFIFLILSVLMCVIQDGVGSALAAAFGLDPLLGLCMGSIPLVGGHGTSGSFGPLLEETYGVSGALTVALAAATYGLVSGSMMGGPIARRRVEKLGLKSTAAQEGNASDDKGGIIDGQKFTNAAVFLAIAMMNLKLWQLAALALPMIVILLVQTVIMFLYANFVIFNVMGRDYEAAAMTSAFCGFGMGATPNAMANMKALAERYGAAPRAFFIVPLVGSLFIDFFNSMVLTTFMNLL